MKITKNVGFIGAGNMAGAIINSMINTEICPSEQIYVFDIDADKCSDFAKKGVNARKNIKELCDSCDIIFLAVKPQFITDVLSEIKKLNISGKTFASIAAGISVSFINKYIGDRNKIIRIMPNTPLMVGCGATAIAESEHEEIEDIISIFACSGEVKVIPESQMNKIIPVNGSSPALFFRMVKSMVQAAGDMGVDYDVALTLAAKSMEGSAKMILKTGLSPEELIAQVTSKGGTTLAALTAFDDMDYEEIITEAFNRCVKRADELGK